MARWRRLHLAAMLPFAAGQTVSCATAGQGYKDAMAKPPAVPNGAFLTDALQCQASCASNPTCSHFTWFTDSHGCWLGFSKSELVAAPKAISGPKICKAPATPAPLPEPVPIAGDGDASVSTQAPKAFAQNTSRGGANISWIWWVLGAGVIVLVAIAACAFAFAQGKKKPKESARKRHMRRTQGMEEEAENDAEEADVERPLMPWEQRKLESRPSGSKKGFKAPDSFVRLPLTAQAPGFAPGFAPERVMEATQQLPGFPTNRYVVS